MPVFFISANTFAQSAESIEAELLLSFKKIDYWDQKRSDIHASDSLYKANNAFGKKLKAYSEKYPFTISQPFLKLAQAGLNIITSPDTLLRIYSWDTALGGTMRRYENIAQYLVNNKTYSINLKTDKHGFEPVYESIYLVNMPQQRYYLAINTNVLSSAYVAQNAKAFTIENGKLNANAKLFKTRTGLHNQLSFDSDLSAGVNKGINNQPAMAFDPVKQVLQIPLITVEGKITPKFITYKFNGQYFVKVAK